MYNLAQSVQNVGEIVGWRADAQQKTVERLYWCPRFGECVLSVWLCAMMYALTIEALQRVCQGVCFCAVYCVHKAIDIACTTLYTENVQKQNFAVMQNMLKPA